MKTIISILILALSMNVYANVIVKSEAAQGKVEFEAVGRPSMVKIRGEGQGPASQLVIVDRKMSGELNVQLQSLTTGIGLRDDHMKNNYLEVAKYPMATLKFKDHALPASWDAKTPALTDFPFKGIMSLHGVEKEVEGIVNVDNNLKARAEFEIKISDFGIAIPSYLGITVADKVKVKVAQAEFKLSESSAAGKVVK